MLFDNTLRDLLTQARTVAIIGAKDKPGSPVDRVGRYLLSAGYRVVPVHPVRKTAWDIPVAASLADLPNMGIEPDIVCLFRAAPYCPDHARETLALPRRPLIFWMQEGIASPEAGAILAGSGIKIVEDLCIKTEHERLFRAPGLSGRAGSGHAGSGLPGDLSPERPTTPSKDQNAAETNTAGPVFECRRCGHCCRGEGGIVVGPADLPRLCGYLGLSEDEFLRRHTRPRGGKPALLSGKDGNCAFYREGEGCAIHPARPDVCRAWPFFRGNLVDGESFAMAREDCPGISRAVSHPDFARAGFAYLRDNGLLASDPEREGRALIVRECELPPDSSIDGSKP